MKNTVKELDMDNIEDLYDDMAEMMADMEEVQEVMGRTYNCEFDEDGKFLAFALGYDYSKGFYKSAHRTQPRSEPTR